MGVAYYYSWIIKNHKLILKNINEKQKFNKLFIDANSIIYDSINLEQYEINNFNKNNFENNLINKVIEKLNKLIKKFNVETTYITFDGIPPLAKINQQKNRRYKSAFTNKLFNEIILWDKSAITTGTDFMKKLNFKLYSTYKNNNKIKLFLSDDKGEGEQKIYKIIRDINNINNDYIIYGLDADLIHLSLNHLKYYNNIFLYRETVEYINSLDKSLDPNIEYFIDINLLAKQIYKLLSNLDYDNNNENDKNNKQLFYNKLSDYVFLCFLLGNDFNPHFPILNLRHNGLEILLNIYKNNIKNNETIIINNNINYKLFKKIIKELSDNEEILLKNIYKIREKISKKTYKNITIEDKKYKFNELPSFERNIELFINPFENCWQHRYYTALFNINIDIDNNKEIINNICQNYFNILNWTFKYYSENCECNTIYYNYEYPPLFQDLIKNIPYFDEENNFNNNFIDIKSNTLLALVLPKSSLHLLPKNIHNYLLKNYENYYCDNYNFIYAFCKYFWEAHVQFPKMEKNDLFEFIKKINSL